VRGESPEASSIGCCLAADGEGASWDAFVRSLPAGGLGHAHAWKQVVERGYGKQAYYLAAKEDGRWVGVLPLVRMKGPLTGNRLVSLPFLDAAGLLAATPQAAAALRAEAFSLAGRLGARGVELRSRAAAMDAGAAAASRATLVLPLPGGAEALWGSFSPKVRNQIRKAEKAGLRTEAAPRERLVDFYRVFAHNMRDLGSPVHSLRFLEAVFDAFAAAAKLYLTVSSSQKVVGGAIAIEAGDTVTVPWASSLREAFPSCPNHSLYWKVLGDTAQAGARRFDFGRSHVDSGTYRFKVQWGAQPLPLAWESFDAGGAPLPGAAFKPAEHTGLTRAWSLLPLWLANAIGPLVRRQLSN
jgi:FemAB-related protein (PEP-CTERM system-associated)